MYAVFGLIVWLVVVEGEPVTKVMTTASPQYSITGNHDGDVNIFLGIPFSKPRTPPHRFEVPEPYIHVAGENFMATDQHGKCVQDTGEGSEDCLYMDVYAPEAASSSNKKMVMVWIHGGSWMNGGKNDYSGVLWASTQWAPEADLCVGVTLNYRMNMLGFPDLAGIPRNLAMYDNIAALTWIKNHISDLGGDENHVTIYGESAGSMQTAQLWASTAARGLFTAVASYGPYVWSYEFGKAYPDEQLHADKVQLMESCLQTAMVAACASMPNGINNAECTYQSPSTAQLVNASCFGTWVGPMHDGGLTISDTFYGDLCTKQDMGDGVPLLIGHNSFSMNLWTITGARAIKKFQMEYWTDLLVSPLNSTCVFQELGDRFEASGMMQDPAIPPFLGTATLEEAKILYATTGVFFNMISEVFSRLPNVYQMLFNESAHHYNFNLCNNPMGAHACEVPFIVSQITAYNASNLDQNIAGGSPMDKVVQANMRRVLVMFGKTGNPGWKDDEVGTWMDHTLVIRTNGAAFAPPVANLLYQVMCEPVSIPPPCGTGATYTCGDIKRAFRNNQCCGSPDKPFDFPMRRLSAASNSDRFGSNNPSILHSIDLALQDAKATGGTAKANRLVKMMQSVLAKYVVHKSKIGSVA